MSTPKFSFKAEFFKQPLKNYLLTKFSVSTMLMLWVEKCAPIYIGFLFIKLFKAVKPMFINDSFFQELGYTRHF